MASPTPPQDQGDSRDETEEERNDRIREDLRARMPDMAGLDRRGELSVSQEDAREIQQRSQQDTRLRNSSRLIRARDAYEARRVLGSQTARVAPSNPTLTEAEGQGAATTPRPDSPLPAPRYRPVGQTENANELHVRQNRPATERTRWSDPTLESRLASVGRVQNILSPEPLQTTQARSCMPTLRSQPEFYMTGVIAVDTTTESLPDNAECTICLEPLSDDVVKFHACGHMFHIVCVQSWFDQSAPRTGVKRGTCPNCRHELYEPDPRFGRARQPVAVERTPQQLTASLRALESELVPPTRPRTLETPQTNTPRVTGSSNRESSLAQFTADMQERVRAHDQQEQQAGNAPAPALDREFVSVTRVPHVAPGSHLPGYAPHRIESSESPRGGTMERDLPTVRLPPVQPSLSSAPDALRQREHQRLLAQQQLNQQRQFALNNSRYQTLDRSAASIAMADALRRPTTFAREAEAGDRLSNVDGPDEHSDVDDIHGVDGRPTFIPERPPTSTFQSNGLSEQPRESRANLAARAIAERRPLSEVPGLNTGFAAIPPLSPQEAAQLVRIRELPGSGLDLATRTTDQLRDEQVMLLDRLRAVQTQIGRNLEASGERATNAAERREQIRAMAWNNPQTAHLYGGPAPGAQDNTAHRPPPIAIPRLADPSVTDLRSSREPPDSRAIGTGNTIWSTDHVAPPLGTWGGHIPSSASNGSLGSPYYLYPSSPGIHHDVSRLHSPLFPFSPDGPRTATDSNMVYGRAFNDERFTLPELPALTARSDTVAAAQPASEGNPNAAAEDTRSVQHPRRISSTVMRHLHDDSLSFRAASTDPTAFRQHPPGRPRPSSYLPRAQEATASDTQRFRSREARSESPQEDDNSTDGSEASS